MQFDFFRNHKPSWRPELMRIGQISVPLVFVVNARARRYILRVRPDGSARITIPRRGSMRAGRDFAERNSAWIAHQLERLSKRPACTRAWHAGDEIFFRGAKVAVQRDTNAGKLTFADQLIHCAEAADYRPAIERRMRMLAESELPPRVIELAQQHRVTVRKVCVRNQKSRWGSCSQRATISLNWRLIQTPPYVSDYIILHELMHLRQMNHSPRFWREVESVCPEFRAAEQWLKAHASLLR